MSVFKDLYERMKALDSHPQRNQLCGEMYNKIGAIAANARDEDFDYLVECLNDDERKYFAAKVLLKGYVPKRFFDPLMTAAIRESNISLNRLFLMPLQKSYGMRAVREAMLEKRRRAAVDDLPGIEKAMYWTTVIPWGFDGDTFDRLRDEISRDAKSNPCREKLKEFIQTSDTARRRAILKKVSLEYRRNALLDWWLITKVILIARGSDDEIIRRRFKAARGWRKPVKAKRSRDTCRNEQHDN